MSITITDEQYLTLEKNLDDVAVWVAWAKEQIADLQGYKRLAKVNLTRLNRAHHLTLLENEHLRARLRDGPAEITFTQSRPVPVSPYIEYAQECPF
jgi:hypothetical protein